MKAENFCYWLQGMFELLTLEGKSLALTHKQTLCIRDHLALVFYHDIDPKQGNKEEQEALNTIHNSTKTNITI